MLVALTESMESVETEEVIQAWLTTLNALLDLGPKGEAAVKKEIRVIIDHGFWRVVRHTDITEREMRLSISSFIFGGKKIIRRDQSEASQKWKTTD